MRRGPMQNGAPTGCSFDLSIFGAKLAKVAMTLRHIAGLLDADLDLEREFYHDLYGRYD